MRSYRDLLIADRVVQAYSLTETATPPNIVQTATGHADNGASGKTVSATFANTPSSTSTLIAIAGDVNVTSDQGAMSPLTWTLETHSRNDGHVLIFKVASDGSTTTFTFTDSSVTANSDMWLVLIEVPGTLTLDANSPTTGSNTGSSWSPSLSANAAPDELEIFAVSGYASGNTGMGSPAATNGFSVLYDGEATGSSTNWDSLVVVTKVTNAQDTPSTALSWTHSNQWAGCGLSFKGTALPAGVGINETWGTLTHNANPALGQTGIPTGEPEGATTYASAKSEYSTGNVQLTPIDPTKPPWSFELWVKTTETAGYQTIACLRNSFNDNSGNCIIFGTDLSNAGDLNMTFTSGGDTNTHITSTVHTYNDGQWHHIVATVTAAGAVSFYVDGVFQSTSGTAQSASTSGGAYINLAANVTGSGPIQYFDGSVAWPAAYGYALTPDQVRRHYLAGRYGIFPKGSSRRRRR